MELSQIESFQFFLTNCDNDDTLKERFTQQQLVYMRRAVRYLSLDEGGNLVDSHSKLRVATPENVAKVFWEIHLGKRKHIKDTETLVKHAGKRGWCAPKHLGGMKAAMIEYVVINGSCHFSF